MRCKQWMQATIKPKLLQRMNHNVITYLAKIDYFKLWILSNLSSKAKITLKYYRNQIHRVGLFTVWILPHKYSRVKTNLYQQKTSFKFHFAVSLASYLLKNILNVACLQQINSTTCYKSQTKLRTYARSNAKVWNFHNERIETETHRLSMPSRTL